MSARNVQPNLPGFPIKTVTVTVVGVLVVLLLSSQFLGSGMFGYLLHDVAADEVGIRLQGNRPYEIVGPGKYTNFGLFEAMINVRVRDIPFRVTDEEVLTADKQRIGVQVTGTVRRPGKEKPDVLLVDWARFKSFYLDDGLLVGSEEGTGKDLRTTEGLMQQLGKQATKVCVGDSTFDKAVIGSSRDDLRLCIAEEFSSLAEGYGLTVSNIMVPNVTLNKEVQARLDAITDSRLATELARQRQLQATAEAEQEQAKQKGQILVEQGRVQERATQDAKTADLQQKALAAQKAVIEAEKANTLLTAQKDREIADVQRQVSETNALAAIAPETARAKVFEANPQYTNYLNTQNMSNALKSTDKVMVVPQGTNPIMSLGGTAPSVILPSAASRP